MLPVVANYDPHHECFGGTITIHCMLEDPFEPLNPDRLQSASAASALLPRGKQKHGDQIDHRAPTSRSETELPGACRERVLITGYGMYS